MLRAQKMVYMFASEGLQLLTLMCKLICKCSILTVNMEEASY